MCDQDLYALKNQSISARLEPANLLPRDHRGRPSAYLQWKNSLLEKNLTIEPGIHLGVSSSEGTGLIIESRNQRTCWEHLTNTDKTATTLDRLFNWLPERPLLKMPETENGETSSRREFSHRPRPSPDNRDLQQKNYVYNYNPTSSIASVSSMMNSLKGRRENRFFGKRKVWKINSGSKN